MCVSEGEAAKLLTSPALRCASSTMQVQIKHTVLVAKPNESKTKSNLNKALEQVLPNNTAGSTNTETKLEK